MSRKPEAPLNEFGRALADAMRQWGGSRKEFLHRFNLENKTLRRYETSETLPRIDQIQEWAEFLGCDAADLVPKSRFCGASISRVEYEKDEIVRFAAERAGLNAFQRQRLYDVRHSVGPMTDDQALSMAKSIKANVTTEGFAHPKVRQGGEYVPERPMENEAPFRQPA